MTKKDLVTKNWNRFGFPVAREKDLPFFSLQREINQLFDSFFRGYDLEPEGWGGTAFEDFQPRLDVKEDEKNIELTVELPGMDEKDIEVSLTSDALTLKGEKKEEKEEKNAKFWRMERRYGSFHRVIPLTEEIDHDNVEASFRKGVLKIVLSKTEKAKTEAKKIQIRT